ncbi:MAG: hypothetical protein A2W09_03020 [Deltaproteobacteria bacterium RBG_16_50_11]|nr:MAG: hypothetical protein A2W09_03020 [Deltaproteobacteria bacterium RBG_16_50_11]
MRNFIRPIMISFILFQIAVFPLATTAAATPAVHPNSDGPLASKDRANVSKILTVLERRVDDPQLLEKTKKKLITLRDGQTRLIASLSDRVAEEGNTTGSDIAFLLMTVLIILL